MGSPRDSNGRDGWQSRTRAHRGGGLSPRAGPAGREQSAAETNVRRGWYGWGQLSAVEKHPLGVFLNDITRVFAEVAILSGPVFLALPFLPNGGQFDIFNMWLPALTGLVLVGSAVRAGWVHPPWTPSPGWVRLFATLIVLRLLYFSVAFLVAIYGGFAVAGAAGEGAAGWLFALAVGAGAALAFPRAADEWMARFG